MYKILANTLFLGKEVIYMPSCHSTNDVAMEILKKPDTKEGLVILAGHQTKGRGQRGNVWNSEPDVNLILSLVLRPGFLKPGDQFFLNIISSLAVCETLKHVAPDCSCKVKWPNDVLLNHKKVAGILIENSLQQNGIQWSVLGVGININQSHTQFEKATTLKKETAIEHGLPEIFETLIAKIELYYLKLKAGRFLELKAEYLQNLFGFQEVRRYRSEFFFDGKITDVTESGKLKMETTKGVKLFDFKEVEFFY